MSYIFQYWISFVGHTSQTMRIEYQENNSKDDFSIKVVYEIREKIIHGCPLILRINPKMKKYNISARNFHLWVYDIFVLKYLSESLNI